MRRISNSILLYFIFSLPIQASTISYDVISLGGNTWEYNYTVNNDMLSVDIEEFTIFFDLGVYENLNIGSTPANWDPLVIPPDSAIFADGFYDALALVSGIAPGDSLGGFSVEFDFLGIGTPGSQFFEIINPQTFSVLDSGFTTVASTNNGIPIPGTQLLFLSGILGMVGCKTFSNPKNRIKQVKLYTGGY